MSKITSINQLKVGDVFWTSFIDHNCNLAHAHPFIVIQDSKGECIQIMTAEIIINAFSMADIDSLHGEALKKALLEPYVARALVNHKKESIIEIRTFFVYEDELSINQSLTQMNVINFFSPKKTHELFKTLIDLSIEDKAVINKNILKINLLSNIE